RLQIIVVQAPEHQHLGTRQQRAIELEGGVLGRGPDQRNGAVFHYGKKRILLAAIETVDFVDEEQRALSYAAAMARGLEGFLQIGNAGKNGGELFEVELEHRREQARDRGLAGSGRPPKDYGGWAAGRDHAPERSLWRKQMILSDDIGQRLRPQAVSQRTRYVLLQPGGAK